MAVKAIKKKSGKTRASATKERFARIARMFGCSAGDITTLAKHTEAALRGVGTALKGKNGRITVFANKPVPMTFTHKKHVVRAKALVKDAIGCPIAKCAKDPEACWLGAYSTSVHVGNVMVTFWSELCPHIQLKCMLSPSMRAAVRNWDDQVKKKVKNRRFNLNDGVHYLSACSPSIVKPSPRNKKRAGKRGVNFNKPSRKLTVRSDIALAIDFLNAQKAAKKKKAG